MLTHHRKCKFSKVEKNNELKDLQSVIEIGICGVQGVITSNFKTGRTEAYLNLRPQFLPNCKT